MPITTLHRADLTRSRVSRYIQLATLFRHRIRSGVWAKGSQIPTIDELTDEFGVARATIRQAIGVLEGEGLVSRFRAKGTFVCDTPTEVHIELTTDWSSLLNPRSDASIEILEDEPGVPAPQMPFDIGKPAESYRRLRRRHVRSMTPYLLADLYIDSRLASRVSDQALRSLTAMRLATAISGTKIVDAHQTLRVGAADINVAELLNLELNAPICLIDRSAVDQRDVLVVVSKGIYRGDMIQMDFKLR